MRLVALIHQKATAVFLIRLPEEGRTWSDIDLVVQTEKFLKDNAGQRPEQATCSQKKRVKTATGKNYSVFSWNHYLQKQMSGRLASAYRKNLPHHRTLSMKPAVT